MLVTFCSAPILFVRRPSFSHIMGKFMPFGAPPPEMAPRLIRANRAYVAPLLSENLSTFYALSILSKFISETLTNTG